MSFLRNEPVNLSRYLPAFLQSDKSLKAMLDSCSMEHEKQRLLLDDISRQLYVQTATWGLRDWESLLDLKPDAGDTYETRRNRILLKLQSHQTSTQEFMSRLASRYVTNGKAEIKEHNEEYAFDVDIDRKQDTTVDTDGLYEAIETYRPAHLAWLLTQHFHADGTVYVGAAPTINVKYEVKPATIHDAALSHTQYVGAAPYRENYYAVYPQTVQDTATRAVHYAGGVVNIYKRVEVTQKEES